MKQVIKVILLVSCAFIVANKSHAAVTIYMKIMRTSSSQITGESTATGYIGDVEISSESQSSNAAVSTGAGTTTQGKVSIGDFSFQTYLSSVSLPLMSEMYTGTHLYSVDLYYVKTGCNCAYYKVHMENVFVTSMSDASSSGDAVAQQFTFYPLQVAWAYYKQSPSGVIPTTPTDQFAWDRTKNTTWTYTF